MSQRHIPSRAEWSSRNVDSDEIQEQLVVGSYVRHSRGGRERGHDWDDWLRADRALKSKGNKRKRGYSEPLGV